ncbi:ferredoxin, partial [candidate division KSB1 bacterium]|nr:ferredoxin [candidate division KSB1 bacterium]
PEASDNPFGERSSAGKLFGVSGGVAEAAVRTAHYLLTGSEMENMKMQPLRGLNGVKETRVKIGDRELGVAVVSGLGNARELLDAINRGEKDIHFIEVMTCSGGCISGGGQPLTSNPDVIKSRMLSLYEIDRDAKIMTSHANPHIKRIYEEFLGEPLSEKSHHVLHTTYKKREVLL